MSITTSAFRLALTAAALCAAAHSADARPRRVVILDFDGPRQLADLGRSSVLSVLGDQYDVVSTKSWEKAKSAASQVTHGPAQWSRAAKQAGVDAIIEGWVSDEGRRKILNVTVREATSGKEFETISVRIDGRNGVSAGSSHQLQTNLNDLLEWIDAGEGETPPSLPPIDVKKIGPRPSDDGARSRRRAPTDDDAAPAPKKRPRRAAEADTEETDDQPRTTRQAKADDRGDRDRSDRDRSDRDRGDRDRSDRDRGDRDRGRDSDERSDAAPPADEPTHEAKQPTVSAADKEIHDIEVIFPPGSDDRAAVLGAKVDHVPQKTPRFMIDAGGYMSSRSLLWDAPPDANITQFAGVSTRGFQVNASIYPWPTKQIDGVLSGVGFTFGMHHSAGSSVEFDNTDTIEEYVLNQNGWELGVHYRYPLSNLVAIDGGAFYGSQTFEILDASPAFEVPDTKYSYLGASAHLDLNITDRATVGFGARYFTVLDSGDLASTEWFGPVSASGLGLEATFTIPLPANLYVRGQLSYQRISLETSGGGQITDDEAVTGGTDSLIVGNVNIGIAF